MSNVEIAISLPQEIVEAAERARMVRGETRSEFFQHAVETFLQYDDQAVERYLQGYREHPETDEEIAAAHLAGVALLALEPWE